MCVLLNINIEKLKIKALELLYSIYRLQSSSIIFLNIKYLYMIRKQKSEKLFPFFSDLNMDFYGLKKKKKHNFTFTFFDIVSIHSALFLSSFV